VTRIAILLTCLLSASARAATISVVASSFQFTPRTITVQVGDTVQWTGISNTGHNAAQSNGPTDTAYNGTGFYSGPTCCSAPTTFDFTFNSPGIYWYLCEAHAAGFDMRGLVIVVAAATPTVTLTPCPTATESPSFTVSPTFTDSPTITPSFTISDTPNPSNTPTDTPTVSPSFTITVTPSISPTATPTPIVSPTVTLTPGSFAAVMDSRLLASPISGGTLHLWAHLTGRAQQVQLRCYSAVPDLMLVVDLAPGSGDQRWTVDLSSLPAGPVWLQVQTQEDGIWRKGPVMRSYIIK
jgi:plastocyanin